MYVTNVEIITFSYFKLSQLLQQALMKLKLPTFFKAKTVKDAWCLSEQFKIRNYETN